MPTKHSIINNILASKFIQHMSKRTNDEKLRILQERLAEIKEKQSKQEAIKTSTTEVQTATIEHKTSNLSWIKYVGIIGVAACVIFYSYKNERNLEETVPFNLTYSFEWEGEWGLAIIGSFAEEGPAKALVNAKKAKGYECDYFFLPDKSNSKEEIYKVFIGPYENEEETNQWTSNLEVDFEIIRL